MVKSTKNARKAGLMGAVTAVALGLSAGLAQAQSFDWSGFYAGAHLDGAVFSAEASDLTDSFTNDAPGVSELVPTYGITAGYNWLPQGGNFVLGVELDATFGNESERLVRFNAAGTDGLDFQNSWDSVISLRVRAGITNDRILTFVSAGPAFADANFVAKDLDPASGSCSVLVCAEADESLVGLAVGAGMEYAFRDNWIGKLEIVHYAMPTTDAPLLTGGTTPTCAGSEAEECTVFFDSSSTTVRFGVNYKF